MWQTDFTVICEQGRTRHSVEKQKQQKNPKPYCIGIITWVYI